VSTPLPDSENRRLEILRDLRVLGTSSEQVFDDFARVAALACDTPIAVVSLVDEHWVWFKARIGLELDHIPRDQAFCTHTILKPDLLTVLDPLADDRFAGSRLVMETGIRFYAGAPLITGNDQSIGALAVMDRVPHLMTAVQLDSLKILARRIVHELELRQTRDAQSPRQKRQLVTSRQPPVTVLLCEDNDNLRDLLCRALQGKGFSVLPTADGREALRLCQNHESTIDLVVSDIVLPGTNGRELSERICAARPETKFLFITGFAEEFPELHDLIEAGAGILEKPFRTSELLREAEHMLKQEKAASANSFLC
jgi:CheY-like chemotaxis protein